MPYWIYSHRSEAHEFFRIDVRSLKKDGYFEYDFNRGRPHPRYNVEVFAYMNGNSKFNDQNYREKIMFPVPSIIIRYQIEDDEGNKKKVDRNVLLEKTTCNLGGVRYWFICPIYSCGRRVGILYRKFGVFACRHCHQLCYASQNENRRMAAMDYLHTLDDKLCKLNDSIKRRSYAGKPTRIQRKIDKLDQIASRLLGTS